MHCFLQRVGGTLIKDHKSVDTTHQEPLSGAGIHMDECKWMQVLSVVLVRSWIRFPILSLLCPCFLQFLSNAFLLPYLLIRGTPQRTCIIPVWSCKPFMSWEDVLVRVLPVPFSFYDTCINFSFPDKSSLSFYWNPLLPLLNSISRFPPVFMLSYLAPRTSAPIVNVGLCLDDLNCCVHQLLEPNDRTKHSRFT